MDVEKYIKGFSRCICEIDGDKSQEEIINSIETYFALNPIIKNSYGSDGRVWVLIGEKCNKDDSKCLQIGQSEDIYDEIYKDVERMYDSTLDNKTETSKRTYNYEDNFEYVPSDKRGKIAYFYRHLKNNYDVLRFYEIIIDKYLDSTSNLPPLEKTMYELSKDYYCEAKLAIEIGTKNWHYYKSGVGKRFYLYLKYEHNRTAK